MIRVAVDLSGSEKGPDEVLDGAILARQEGNLEIILVGQSSAVAGKDLTGCSFLEAPLAIPMSEKVSRELLRNQDSSLFKIVRLVQEGKADAAVSGGNTACFVALARDGLTSALWPRFSVQAAVIIACLAVGTGASGDTPLSCSYRTPGTDVVVLSKLGKKIQTMVDPNKYIVTFDPVVAANAHRKIYPGMEFELFGFYPIWGNERVQRYKLYNWPMLKDALVSEKTGAVVLASRRWTDETGMGRLLKPYRAEILDTVRGSSRLVDRVEAPTCVGIGEVQIYEPARSSRAGDSPDSANRASLP